MFSLYDLLFNTFVEFATVAYGWASTFLGFLIFGVETLFTNPNVLWYETFLSVFAEILLVVGTGFAFGNWAISATEGNPENIMNTFKNMFLGLFATLGFIVIPVNLLRFTCECCQLLIQDMSLETIESQINETISTDTTIWGVLILPMFCIIILVCMIKVFLSNIKRGGTLLVLLTVCPLHIFNIPRGYTDGFFSWCKQVLALSLTTFVQNFLVSLSFLIISSEQELGTTSVIMSLGVTLAAMEAPRILQQFGLDTTVRTNVSQALYAVNSTTSLVRNFGA